jgi:hypothetical protein
MSAGDFDFGFYELDNGSIVPVRAQPETADILFGATQNDFATGPATVGLPSAKISKGEREIGIGPRSVSVRFDTNPTDYTGDLYYFPVFQASVWAGLAAGTEVTYLGATGEVVRRFPESIV